MSETAPAWEDTLDHRALSEFSKLRGEIQDELTELVLDVCRHRQPSEHPKMKLLDCGGDLMRLRFGDYRAVCTHAPPLFVVLLIDRRSKVYDRLDTALERAEDYGGGA